MMQFNFNNYLKLFRKEKELNSKNSSLFKENQEEYDQFFSLLCLTEDAVFHKKHLQFLQIVELFLIEKRLDILEFSLFFSVVRDEALDAHLQLHENLEELPELQMDEKATDYSKLITKIFHRCISLDVGKLLETSDIETVTTQFRQDINSFYQQLKQY